MKVSKAQAAENRQGILDAASRLYRERGLTGVGVADITRDAGLTHGGLYRHFESKDALVREACARAFDWSIAPLDGHTPNASVADRVKSYLSPQHRDTPGSGCPAAALAVDQQLVSSVMMPEVARRLENILRTSRSDNLELTYEALKAYLMLATPERYDPEALKAWITLDWERNLLLEFSLPE